MISQIAYLVKKYKLSPESTAQEIMDWYRWAYLNNHLEMETDAQGTVLGFMDWVRLEQIPDNTKRAYILFQKQKDTREGPVLFVCNTYSNGKETFMRMRRKMFDKNIGAKYLVYHNKRRNAMKIFNMKEASYV